MVMVMVMEVMMEVMMVMEVMMMGGAVELLELDRIPALGRMEVKMVEEEVTWWGYEKEFQRSPHDLLLEVVVEVVTEFCLAEKALWWWSWSWWWWWWW